MSVKKCPLRKLLCVLVIEVVCAGSAGNRDAGVNTGSMCSFQSFAFIIQPSRSAAYEITFFEKLITFRESPLCGHIYSCSKMRKKRRPANLK